MMTRFSVRKDYGSYFLFSPLTQHQFLQKNNVPYVTTQLGGYCCFFFTLSFHVNLQVSQKCPLILFPNPAGDDILSSSVSLSGIRHGGKRTLHPANTRRVDNTCGETANGSVKEER